MKHVLTDLPALADHGFDTVIDVRAPSEFAVDHIPGAVNLPVLDDEERARIGAIHVRQSAFLARKLGAALVARNAAAHIEGPLAHHDGGWQPLVYCWRGGQRSGGFASILAQIGWRVQVIEGGYRSYRRLVKGVLYDTALAAPTVLLDGYTGTAKTELLALVAARGGQVLDLEGLARHRGSVFGGRAAPQPAQKGFESALARQVAALDPARPVLVEAESSKVGTLTVPPALWKAMRGAPRITVSAPLEARAAYLTRAYGDIVADPERLSRTLRGLTRLQGRAQVAEWQALADTGDFAALAASLMARHYDPRYATQRARAEGTTLAEIAAERLDRADLERVADRIVAILDGAP